MSTNAIEVSPTTIRSYLVCPRRVYYETFQGLRPLQTTQAIQWGTVFHEGMRYYYEGGRNVVIASKMLREDFPDYTHLEDVILMMKAYHRWVTRNGFDAGLEQIASERRYTYRLIEATPGALLSLKPDGIFRKGNATVLMEFKTVERIPTDFSFLLVETQCALYQRCMREILYPLDANPPIIVSDYRYIRRRVPIPRPSIRKDGGPSRAVKYTTLDLVDELLDEHGLHDDPRWLAYRGEVERAEDSLFRRVEVVVPERIQDDILDGARKIARMMDEGIFPMAGNKMVCPSCAFLTKCVGDNTFDSSLFKKVRRRE